MSKFNDDEIDSWHKNPGGPFPPWLTWIIIIVVFGLLVLAMQA